MLPGIFLPRISTNAASTIVLEVLNSETTAVQFVIILQSILKLSNWNLITKVFIFWILFGVNYFCLNIVFVWSRNGTNKTKAFFINVCLRSPTSPPWSPIGLVSCVPAYTLSSPAFKGVTRRMDYCGRSNLLFLQLPF